MDSMEAKPPLKLLDLPSPRASNPATVNLVGRYEAHPVNESAGKLDTSERAGIAISLVTGLVAILLIFTGAYGITRGEAFSAGLGLLTASAVAARASIKD